MGRGSKRTKSNEAKPPVASKSPKDDGAKVRDLEKRLSEALKDKAAAQEHLQTRDRELIESLDQQTATSDILRVINQSQANAQPVLDSIAASAARLCDASASAVFRFDGERTHFMAHYGASPEGVSVARRAFPMKTTRDTAGGRAVLDVCVVNVEDAASNPDDFTLQRAAGFRSFLAVPMVQKGAAVGYITVSRADKRPFSDKHIGTASRGMATVTPLRRGSPWPGRTC